MRLGIPGHALHDGFKGTNRHRHTGQQPGTKSARGPGAKPRMNRGSTAGFVPPSVYIGFPLFVLTKGRSGQLSTIPRGSRGTVGFWATRPVGVLFCPAPLRAAAPPCAAPTRTARGMFGFWTRQIDNDRDGDEDDDDVGSAAFLKRNLNKRTGRIQNPNIPRAARVGAHGGAAERVSQDWTQTEQSAPKATRQTFLVSPKASKTTSSERLFRSTNKRNPM